MSKPVPANPPVVSRTLQRLLLAVLRLQQLAWSAHVGISTGSLEESKVLTSASIFSFATRAISSDSWFFSRSFARCEFDSITGKDIRPARSAGVSSLQT